MNSAMLECPAVAYSAYFQKLYGRYEVAIDMMNKATRIRRKSLGFDHPDTMNTARILDEWLAQIEGGEGSELRASEEVFSSVTDCQRLRVVIVRTRLTTLWSHYDMQI